MMVTVPPKTPELHELQQGIGGVLPGYYNCHTHLSQTAQTKCSTCREKPKEMDL